MIKVIVERKSTGDKEEYRNRIKNQLDHTCRGTFQARLAIQFGIIEYHQWDGKFYFKKPQYKTPRLNYPTRIVEFEFKKGSETTLNMIMDEGWEVSFRIHSADKTVESSLKFDITLIGNPPILFTQHLFQ